MGKVISIGEWKKEISKMCDVKETNNPKNWTLKEMLEDTLNDIKLGIISPNAKGIVCIEDENGDLLWNNAQADSIEASHLLAEVLVMVDYDNMDEELN